MMNCVRYISEGRTKKVEVEATATVKILKNTRDMSALFRPAPGTANRGYKNSV